MFLKRFIIFVIGAREKLQNTLRFETDFVLTLPRAHPILLALRILISWFFNRNFQEIITLSHWCKRCIKEVFN